MLSTGKWNAMLSMRIGVCLLTIHLRNLLLKIRFISFRNVAGKSDLLPLQNAKLFQLLDDIIEHAHISSSFLHSIKLPVSNVVFWTKLVRREQNVVQRGFRIQLVEWEKWGRQSRWDWCSATSCTISIRGTQDIVLKLLEVRNKISQFGSGEWCVCTFIIQSDS